MSSRLFFQLMVFFSFEHLGLCDFYIYLHAYWLDIYFLHQTNCIVKTGTILPTVFSSA